VCAELNVAAPSVHFLPDHIAQLLEIALNCPSVCPQRLSRYIIDKVTSMPVPSPRAAVTWLHFANWQIPQVRLDSMIGAPRGTDPSSAAAIQVVPASTTVHRKCKG
jgi:hypothetical protein